jgi:hypothetical protein
MVSNLDTSVNGGGGAEHQVTVVLLDSSGRRIGETSAAVHFYMQDSR